MHKYLRQFFLSYIFFFLFFQKLYITHLSSIFMPVDVFIQGPLSAKAVVNEQQRKMTIEWRCTKESFLDLLGYQIEAYGGKHTAVIGSVRALGRESYSFEIDLLDLFQEARQKGAAMKQFGITGKSKPLADHEAASRNAWAKVDVRIVTNSVPK